MKNGLIKKWIQGRKNEKHGMSNSRKESLGKKAANLVKDEPVNCSSHSDEEENIGEIPDAKQQKLH